MPIVDFNQQFEDEFPNMLTELGAVPITATDLITSATQIFDGIFDDEYLASFESPSLPNSTPMIIAQTSDLRIKGVVAKMRIDFILLGVAQVFIINDLQPDGTGLTEIRLRQFK